MARQRAPIGERLAAGIAIQQNNCWLWIKNKDRDGYGVMTIGHGKQYRVHRIAYEFYVGPIPDGMIVCHSCDTPPCINPSHLFVGTARDNVRDMWAKGRRLPMRGESHPMARLSDEQVVSIRTERDAGEKLLAIANKYGVSFQHVSALVHNRCRK